MTQAPGQILAQTHLDLDLTHIEALGINGEVAAIAACERLAGHEAPFEEVMGITATAFRTHFFRPRDNPGMPIGPLPQEPDGLWAPRYAPTCLRHNNYGHCESAAFYYGGEVRPVEGLGALATWRLIRFELDAGHPVLAYGFSAPEAPDLIVGYRLEKAPLGQFVTVLTRRGTIEVNLTSRDAKDGEGLYPRELLLVRPGSIAEWRGSDDARRIDALRWAHAHTRTGRELIYESSRFYATGPKAYEAFVEFLRVLLPDELNAPISTPIEETPAALARFCLAVLDEWGRARAAAAAYLKAWADDLEQAPRTPEGLAAGPEGLRALSTRYEACARALSTMAASIPTEPAAAQGAAIADGAFRERLALGLERARDLELNAAAELASVLGL